MAKAHGGSPKKSVLVTEDEAELAAEFAALNGVSVSALIAEWIDSYVENGSDYVAPTMVRLQSIVDPELVALAEARAHDEGATLRDIIRFEISEIRKM